MHIKHLSKIAGSIGAAALASRPHVLCADDDPALRFTVAKLLTRAGYEVTTVKDGAEAWEALQVERFDLLITDQEMPRLDGLGLVAKARLHGLRLPAILVTGSFEALAQADYPRFTAALLKPCSGNQLLKAVEHALSPETLSTSEKFSSSIVPDPSRLFPASSQIAAQSRSSNAAMLP